MDKTQDSELGGYNVFNKNYFTLKDQLNLTSSKIKLFRLEGIVSKQQLNPLNPINYIFLFTLVNL